MPYAVGLQAATTLLLCMGLSSPLTSAIIVLVVIAVSVVNTSKKVSSDSPVSLPGHSFFHVLPFFRRRFDFLHWGFQASGQSIFRFNLLKNTVVVVSGESARQTFMSAKDLDLTEGFKILSGAIPMVRGVTADLQTRRVALIHKRLAAVQRNAPLTELIPLLLEDTRRGMESWGTSGIIDPFDKVYELVFQLTIRSLSCSEISEDAAVVSRLKVLYDKLDQGTTPATVLLPWLPTPAMIKKLWATKEIYQIVSQAINARVQSGISRQDTLQMLLDNDDERLVIVGFIMGLLIAGARATGTTASWMLTFLSGHPEWRNKAKAEVESLLASVEAGSPESPSLSSRLASVPLELWESETPVLDSIIKETLRVAQPHTAMRRNLGPEMHIDGKVIHTGDYVVYPFSDVHLDPELYPDPWKFDPGRLHDVKAPYGYVGWGGGKTMCLGTRLAKVELKLITSMFLLGFQHWAVDKAGAPAPRLPTPNWNDILLCRPSDSPTFKYERSGIPL